ncbi:hypothetical protein X772_00330 [Mesorhizobium sp. LSJC280B00]|nr:hypothetical protein X772_00330 [Mesorhizobium sp. LSJC280B00]
MSFGRGTFNKFPPKVYPACRASFVNSFKRSSHRWTLIEPDVRQWRRKTLFQNNETVARVFTY